MPYFSTRVRTALAVIAAGAGLVVARTADAEPVSCLSKSPNDWPAPSKPYFMVIVDTSGSMGTAIASGTNSCGYQHNRIGDARCAVRNTVDAFAGQVNFGLATYTWKETCPTNAGTCASDCNENVACFTNTGCKINLAPNDDGSCGPITSDSSLNKNLNDNTGTTLHSGGLVAVPIVQDDYWSPPEAASNYAKIFGLVDNNCGNQEIGSYSATPLGGALFNMYQYFSGTYVDQFAGGAALPSPIGPATFGGQPAERTCRSLNVILITDGDETCDGYDTGTYPNFEGLAVHEASRLLTGVTPVPAGPTFGIKTYVIGFVGATISALDHIASAGGTTKSFSTANESDLSKALASIVGSAIKPETCDNSDNNCNGCTDEGFNHYCDSEPTPANCCAWTTAAQRTACLTGYSASITAANPKGDVTKLPCTTLAQSQAPATWLCYDPGERCDGVDNNCSNGVDDGVQRCGNPLHCPQTEICDGQDNNCDGSIDEGGVCVAGCVPSPEICDGCDNDCDGFADNGVADVPCGLIGSSEAANCAGVFHCPKDPTAVGVGKCESPAGGFSACTATPAPETCDGLDNDCDGIVDNGVATTACVPPGTPPGLNFGANSQCKMGVQGCAGACSGFVGPSAEVCDGIDNDCNGIVDDSPANVGEACGNVNPPCMGGTSACVNGKITCVGATGGSPEICDGLDNDCNGIVDDAPFADAPMPGATGCWDLPGNCCSFSNTVGTIAWCPPTGGTCTDNGTLVTPCGAGVLKCDGVNGYACIGAKDPAPEICDNVDNDCNGQIDDGTLPMVGGTCGNDVGACKPGTLACVMGVLACTGGTQGTAEICNGIDDNCNGEIDEGITTGGSCTPTYDTTLFPGDRTKGACRPGIQACDGSGNVVCTGGVGPSPEVCDDVDNDCDGQVDEVGAAPDGIDGTANPIGTPTANIGDVCGGKSMTACLPGKYACLNGAFACLGGDAPQPETCDCNDNDCDGTIDNPNPTGGPPLCGTGKSCVKGTGGCQCAAPCSSGEFPCPTGQTCTDVDVSSTGMPAGKYCVTDTTQLCAACPTSTIRDADSNVLCGPAGTDAAGCTTTPVCACDAQRGCHAPCAGVSCTNGKVCAELGPKAGTCVENTCLQTGCQGCDKVCNHGSCVDDPCKADTCPAGQACYPNATFDGHTCGGPCGGKTCDSGQSCVAGACVQACDPACGAGTVCDATTKTCAANKCASSGAAGASALPPFACCDPLTGAPGGCPCDGVVCPSGQACSAVTGACAVTTLVGGSGGASGVAGGGGKSASGGGANASGGANAGGGADASGGSGTTVPNGGKVVGLATGGGGCSVADDDDRNGGAGLAVLAIGYALARRRQRKQRARTEVKS